MKIRHIESAYPYSREEMIEYIEKIIIPSKKYSKTTIDKIKDWNEIDINYSYEEFCGRDLCYVLLSHMINDGVVECIEIQHNNDGWKRVYFLKK